MVLQMPIQAYLLGFYNRDQGFIVTAAGHTV
jgi:hypothetical protein